MQGAKVALAAAVLLAVTLAGCSGGSSESGGFSIKGPDGNGAYTFTASGSADNYTWDLGDHLTRAFGKSVTHTYDFANGVVPVVLTTTKAGVEKESRKDLILGTGTNGNAAFVLEGETNWTLTDQSVSFSAHRSTDPDSDPLRYTWSCQRYGDAVRQTPHVHAGFGGKPFATPPAGSVVSINAQGPLPTPDRTIDGDLCDSLGPGSRPSLDATITGKFTKSGVYDIYLLASDPVHPTTSGKYRIVVTPVEEKPSEIQVFEFTGSFMGGSGGTVQGICLQLQQCVADFDQVTHSFSFNLDGQDGYATLAYSDPTPTGTLGIACDLKRGTAPVGTVTGTAGNVTLEAGSLKAGSYTATCTPQAGIPTSPEGTPYTLKVVVDLDMDPFKVY